MSEDTTETEMEQYFEWLDQMRASGTKNMMLARLPLAENFGLSKRESTDVHHLWMRSFNPMVPVYERARWATKKKVQEDVEATNAEERP